MSSVVRIGHMVHSRTHALQLDNVRMSEQFEVLYLASDLSYDIQVLNLLSVEYFDGHFVSGQLVSGR